MDTFEDLIVNEVREIRRQHAERHDYDLDKIVTALQVREQGVKDIVQPPPPKPSPTTLQQKL